MKSIYFIRHGEGYHNLDNYSFDNLSLEKMLKDYSSVYAVTDEKFDKIKFDKKVEKKKSINNKRNRGWAYILFW